MTSCWCWVSWASPCRSTRSRSSSGRSLVAVVRQKSSSSGGVFSHCCVVFIALRIISVLSHVLCPVSFLFLLQPTSTPTRSWDGERKPLRSVPWRRDTSTEFSCTNELSDWSFCLRETTRWASDRIPLSVYSGNVPGVQSGSRTCRLLVCVISVLTRNTVERQGF